MNSRKINLRKLRLPSKETTNDARNRLGKVTMAISEFFPLDRENILKEDDADEVMECSEPMPSPIEYSEPMPSPIEKLEEEPPKANPSRLIRTKLKTFLPKEKRKIPNPNSPEKYVQRKSNVFETPIKTIKAAPKIKPKTKNNVKSKTKPRSKKQQTIKSAFFQQEELFSDVAAQHCLVDNINPDEMQMALALSRSEMEISGSCIEEQCVEKNDGIRDKLKKFGFQVAETEEFSYAATYKLSKGKNRWANKFTPLTLRNAKRQMDKVNQKVEEILKYQFETHDTATCEEESPAASIHSSVLLPFVATSRIIQFDPNENLATIDFYVLSLFEPSRTKAGHLLKDMRRIPGRDKSPENIKSSSPSTTEQDSHLNSPQMKRVRVDENILTYDANIENSPKENLDFSQLSLPSTIYAPDDMKQRRRKTSSFLDLQNTQDSMVLSLASTDCQTDSDFNSKQIDTNLLHENYSGAMNLNGECEMNSVHRSIRATSPDIFADSDVEMEMEDDCDTEKRKCTPNEDSIVNYDILSSGEVKIMSDSYIDSWAENRNSIIAMIDLTQQESEKTISQFSADLSPEPTQTETHPASIDLLSTSIHLEPSDQNMISPTFPPITDTSNENILLYNSTTSLHQSKNSFDSNALDDFLKPTLFDKSKEQEESIDLTQNDDESDDCILLSDDEVNYSIRKADKSVIVKTENTSSEESFESNVKEDQQEQHEFSLIDFVGASQPLASQSDDIDINFSEKSNNSLSSLEVDLSKRSEFGILEEQSPFKTPTKTPRKTPRRTPTTSPKRSPRLANKSRRSLSESFFDSPTENVAPLKRFSSSNKFKEFTKSDEAESFSDLDDIDKLIYGSPTKKIYKKPTGLTQLLTGPINDKVVTPEKASDDDVPQEFEFNGRIYLVRSVDVTKKPNYATMDESALLDKLYRYGIKNLKRKQAERILEYIYNQTHPCLVDETDLPLTATEDRESDFNSRDMSCDEDENEKEIMNEGLVSKFNLKDCWGDVLVSDTVPSMEIVDEQFFFPTIRSKKISTTPLPLHIAWYNLIKSNTQLHEAILHFEPIDLQEVYLFFKSIGYRYDPKDMKYFFDSRSIIFRYDVNKSESSGANRHVRKKRQRLKKTNKEK